MMKKVNIVRNMVKIAMSLMKIIADENMQLE